MKNLFLMALLALTMSLSAQFSMDVQATYGGNYAIVQAAEESQEAYTGINGLLQVTITNELDKDLGLELSLAAGYSSLGKTYRTTVGQARLGLTDNRFMSGGAVVQFMDYNDAISVGLYGQVNYPLIRDEMKNPKLSLVVGGTLLANVLEFQQDENPGLANGYIGVKYTL